MITKTSEIDLCFSAIENDHRAENPSIRDKTDNWANSRGTDRDLKETAFLLFLLF